MRRMSRWIRYSSNGELMVNLFLFVALTAWPLWGVATAQAAEPERLQALVAELVPVVEEQAGRTFFQIPELVIADAAILADVLYEEQVHLLQNLVHLDETESRASAQRSSAQLSSAFVGKYGFLDKKLYVVSDGIRSALAQRGVDPREVEPVIAIVLAHELTHALQDQHTDLNQVVTSRIDADAVMAVNCLVEGHAVWVHERVGAALGYESAIGIVREILGYAERATPPTSTGAFYTSYVYGKGRAFVAHHADSKGPEATWKMLVNPPADTSMIVIPETYNPHVAPAWRANVRNAVALARMSITPPSWKPIDEGIGDYHLRQNLVDAGNYKTLADHWTAGWSSSAIKHATEWAEVELLAFDSDEYAQRYVDYMRAHAEMTLALAAPPVTSAFLPDVRGKVTTYTDVEADSSAHEHLTMRLDGGPEHEVHNFWVARDAYVVQVRVVNHKVPKRQIARAIRRVFRSLD